MYRFRLIGANVFAHTTGLAMMVEGSLDPDGRGVHFLIAYTSDEVFARLEEHFSKPSLKLTPVKHPDDLAPLLDAEHFDLLLIDSCFGGERANQLIQQIATSNPDQAVVIVSNPACQSEAYSLFRSTGALDVIELDQSETHEEKASVTRILQWFEAKDTSGLTHPEGERFERCLTSEEAARERLYFQAAEELFAQDRISKKQKLRFDLVFQECVANALEHGNLELKSVWKEEIDEEGRDRFTKEKKIRLSLPKFSQRRLWIRSRYDDSTLELEIEDEGPGFEAKIEKKNASDDVVPHGRGLQILFSVMDSVVFEKGGRRIRLTKDLRVE